MGLDVSTKAEKRTPQREGAEGCTVSKDKSPSLRFGLDKALREEECVAVVIAVVIMPDL